jgi:hypothetical protein
MRDTRTCLSHGINALVDVDDTITDNSKQVAHNDNTKKVLKVSPSGKYASGGSLEELTTRLLHLLNLPISRINLNIALLHFRSRVSEHGDHPSFHALERNAPPSSHGNSGEGDQNTEAHRIHRV